MNVFSYLLGTYLTKFVPLKNNSLENHLYYSQRIQSCKKEYDKANRRYQFYGTLRLFSFISIGLSIYIFWGTLPALIVSPIFFVLFLYLVHLSVDAKYLRDKQKKLIEINERELHVLSGNWHHFKEGNEYKDSEHAFAYDMDLFGKKSIYQLFNRTVSRKGSDLLAAQLKYGTSSPELSNVAIEDLSKQPDWCQEFIAEGMVFKEEDLEKEFQNIKLIHAKQTIFATILRFAIPIVSITMTALYSMEIITDLFFLMYVVFVFSLVGKNLKNANRVSKEVTDYGAQVKMFQRQLTMFQNVPIQSNLLEENRAALFANDESLVASLMKLEKIQQRMDFRMNILVGAVLNFFLGWDFQILNQWENWRLKHEEQLGNWEKQLAQIEVWISGAVLRMNFPESIYAKFTSNESIHITGLGHPFVPQHKRITNDVELADSEHFLIITGPNMAGKSTYLRSLGLAFICANAGFPILAKSCEIPKLKLYSSMRTSDDLTVESSYFHAELTRLRFIMDAIERGEKVFVILDEILKGTNSKDKEIGSAKFLQKLERLKTKGVIATHDLSLCNLAIDDNAFKNMYFDSTIFGEHLSFDYKIRDGICQNMNASFLLKQMNLVD